MTSLNRADLIGYLGKDPQLEHVGQQSRPLVRVSLATSWKGKEGGEKTTWHNLVFWNRLAEVAAQYLKKGSLIYVEGTIDNRVYEKQDGTKGYISEVIVRKMTMLPSKRDPGGGGAPPPAPASQGESHLQPTGGQGEQEGQKPYNNNQDNLKDLGGPEEDIPF